MNRRRLLLVVAVVAVVALAGCSSGGGSTTTAPADSVTTVETTVSSTDSAPTTSQSTSDDGGDETTSVAGSGTGTDQSTPTPTPTADVSASQLTERVADSTPAVEDYTLSLNMTVETFGNNLVQTSRSNQTIAVDRAAMAFHRTNRQQVRGQTVTTQSYLLAETLYSKSPANPRAYGSEWTKLDVSDNTTEAFAQWDELEHARQYLANATHSTVGLTSVDGTPVYVFDAEINASAYTAINGLENTSTVHNVTATYYVDRETDRLERVDMAINWTLSLRGQSFDQHIVGTYSYDYGDVSITLPDAASSAVAIGNESDGASDQSGDDDPGETDDQSTDNDSETDDDSESSSSDDTQSTTDSPGIDVQNGALSVDPDDVFHRVERELDTNVSDPDAVSVLDPLNRSASDAQNDSDEEERRTFADLVGLDAVSLVGQNVSVGDTTVPYAWVAEVRVNGVGRVYLRSAEGMPADIERMLTTHEFVHYVQLQNGRFTQVNTAVDSTTTDGFYAQRATIEGAAVYTTDTIHERDGRSGPKNSALYRGVAAVTNASSTAYGNSWYHFGNRYVDQRVDSPADLSTLYENPPTTSEQVLHNLTPSAEPPAALSVLDQTGSEYVLADAGRKGEAFTRFVLQNGVSADRAATAAAGWGNDTLQTIRPSDGGTTSYVWVHRWDDAQNATEFADAARAYLDDYGTTENGTTMLDGVPVTLRTLDDRTTALVLADAPLQSNLTVSADGHRVTIAVE